MPIIPGILSAWILNLSDRIFIERFFSTTEVGIYSLGYQISGLVLIFSVAFKKAYDPYFYKIANSRSLHFAKRQLYNTNFIFVIVLLFATFVISFFAKEGIFAIRRVKKSDMERLAKATGAKVASNLESLTENDLGYAKLVEETKVGDEEMVFVEQCQNPKSVTLLVCGGTEHVADEIKRAVTDALGDIAAALKEGKVVAGAGAVEMEIARGLRGYARTLSGREQLAVQAFADAVEIIPRTLAENAGLDPIDVLTKLRSAHDQNQKWAGVNVATGATMNAWVYGVIEPLKVKTQALSSASEVAEMILRIDDVILGSQRTQQGMPPGMGGMPGMM